MRLQAAPGSAQHPPSPPQPDPGTRPGQWWLTTGLAFVAGFADALSFVAFDGLLVAHVTGNFILLGAEAAGLAGGGAALKLLAFPVFIAAVGTTDLVVRALQIRGVRPLRALLGLEAALLALFLALAGAGAREAGAMCGVAAMGLQNGAARLLLPGCPPTTVMTGNTTQVVLDLVSLSRVPPRERTPVAERLRRLAPAIVAFGLGALAGALGYAALGVPALLLPVSVLAALCAVARDPDRAP